MKLNIATIASILLASLSISQAFAVENQLPESWYVLPENSASPSSAENAKAAAFETNHAANTMSKIYSAYTESLEKGVVTKAKSGKWHLSRMSAELGLSHGGRLGLLPFKGTASSAVFWRRAGANTNIFSDSTAQQEMNLEYKSNMTEQQINAQTKAIAEAILATGKIKDVKKFISNLFEITKEFMAVAQHLQNSPHPYWQVSRYYLDRTFSANGDLIAGVGTSAEIRLRLSWKLNGSPAENFHAAAQPSVQTQKLQSNLTNLFIALADDMTWASAQFPSDLGYAPKSFRFGLGFGNDLDVGVVKVGLQAVGHLELERTSNPLPSFKSLKQNDGVIALIATKATTNDLNYAKANSIEVESILPDGSAIDRMAYKVNRQKIRDGLSYAMKMAAKMISPAKKIGKSWEVYRLDMNYQMGVGGAFALPILDGTSTTQMSFVRN